MARRKRSIGAADPHDQHLAAHERAAPPEDRLDHPLHHVGGPQRSQSGRDPCPPPPLPAQPRHADPRRDPAEAFSEVRNQRDVVIAARRVG